MTGNFRFPNSSPTCISWAQGTNIIDTYCYNPFVHDTRTPISLPKVRIRSIVYDPPGSDTDKEQISLELLSPSSIDLNTLKLRIGTRNVAIH